MSDERRRRDEWAPLLDAWPAPRPTNGFADRVLAACEAPPPATLRLVREPPPHRSARGGLLLCAAIAAASILIPFALHRRQPSTSAASVAAIEPSVDLGPAHD